MASISATLSSFLRPESSPHAASITDLLASTLFTGGSIRYANPGPKLLPAPSTLTLRVPAAAARATAGRRLWVRGVHMMPRSTVPVLGLLSNRLRTVAEDATPVSLNTA